MARVSKGLTPKMKNFCHAYARCGDATQAYLEAYDGTSKHSASIEGSRLLQRDDVTKYLNELNQPTINKIINERERKRNILWKGIERCVAKEDESGAARYMDILNKMDAEYVNINRNIDDSSEKLSSLSTEQLKQLLNEPTDQ
jgi:phage terminase small subunit